MLLVLLVLHGERKRNAILTTLLDRLGREAGVVISRQDR
jgi:heme exporter protein D